jgi:hypothetical protein
LNYLNQILKTLPKKSKKKSKLKRWI